MADFLTNLAKMALGFTDNKIKPISLLFEAEWLKASSIQNYPVFSNPGPKSNQDLQNIQPKEFTKNNDTEIYTRKKITEQANTILSTDSREVTQTNSVPIENNLSNSRQGLINNTYSKPTIELKSKENPNQEPKLVEKAKIHTFNDTKKLLNNKTILESDIQPNQNEKINSSMLEEKPGIASIAQAALPVNQTEKTTGHLPTQNSRLSNQVQKENNSINAKASNARVFGEHEKIANNTTIKNSAALNHNTEITKSNASAIDSKPILKKTPITVMNSSGHNNSNVKLLENMQPPFQLPLNDQKPKITLPKIKITIQRLHIRAPNKPKLINKKHSTPSPTISLIDYLNQSR